MSRSIDLTGQRFGKLLVIKKNGKDKWNRWEWLCKCDCGGDVVVRSNNLRTGNSESCGCVRREIGKHVIDLSGRKFGSLTVIQRDMDRIGGDRTYWICECECGNRVSVWRMKLTSGQAKTCKKRGAHAKSDSARHAFWADSVKEKFGCICQKCGFVGDHSSLHAHHILSFTANEDTRFDIDNGSCLCEPCHKEFHNKYGVMRNTIDDFNEWLTKKGEEGA